VGALTYRRRYKAGIDRSERVAALKRLVKFGEERIRQRRKDGTSKARKDGTPETESHEP
jgi:hypothetical protein